MSRRRSFATAIAVLLLAAPLAAQSVSRDTAAVIITPSPAPVVTPATPDPLALLSPTWAPAWTNAGAATRANATAVRPVLSIMSPQKLESGTMMVVGGAALLVGAIVGGKAGTVVMVAGGAFGLLGLWTYLK